VDTKTILNIALGVTAGLLLAALLGRVL